ncbi:MAG: site-2 protease family protein [Candidatus Caccovivens sp.]
MKKFHIHPTSVLIWVWLFVFLGVGSAISYLLAILLHEYGHYFMAKRLGYKLSRFSISPYGAELAYSGQNFDFRDELKIALAGPIVNLLSSLLVVGIWWVFPIFNYFSESFVYISLLLALFNLLPAYPLDGGRVFICLFSYFTEKKLAKRITIICNIILSVFFFATFFVCCFINFNPSLLLFGVFLVLGCIDLSQSTKFEKVNIFQKEIKKIVRPVVLCVNKEATLKELVKCIQTSKTHLFCYIAESGKTFFLSEKLVLKLLENYNMETYLKDIIKN